MDIIWTLQAANSLEQTLDYWSQHNSSSAYSLKIIDQITLVEKSISENPYFLSKFIDKIGLHQRHFFNGKFSLYYDIIEEENLVIIKFFRSNKQKPLSY